MDRRHFLKSSMGAAVSLSTLPFLSTKAFAKLSEKLNPIHEINLFAVPKEWSLLEGAKTKMWSFHGQVVQGAPQTLRDMGSYLGPLIEVEKGEVIKINFHNQLPEKSIVHWHGLHLPEEQDGHPSYAIKNGESYEYELEINNRAGLYWYHPHPHGRTGYQVYMGLAGLLVVRDNEEKALNLPSGDNERFFVLQDRHFDEDNQLIYIQSGHDMMMGKMGDQLFINGSKNKMSEVHQESYRLRLLNGSNARTYRLQWSDGRKITLIGTDGGLLENPVERENILFSPGERLDIIVDFSKTSLNEEVRLLSVPLVEDPRAKAFDILQFKITQEGVKHFELPTKLSSYHKLSEDVAINKNVPKVFKLFPAQGLGWTIDGLPYEMNTARDKEKVKLGTAEIWEFDLTQAGMIHPIHIHGSQFQILERIPGPFSQDLVFDEGWKDTVAVLPGDRVRVIKHFNDYKGKFLYHCHILEHEDNTMMREFHVD